MTVENDDIMQAVVKRAVGYKTEETVEEYAVVDGALELVKKRVTVKDVPPDIQAAKMVMETTDFSEFSDEKLEAEKKRLLAELKAQCDKSK